MPQPLASISELERLIAKQKKRVEQLRKRRNRLTSEIARIDEKVSSLLGKPAVRRKVARRGKRGKGLKQFILDVLSVSPAPKTAAEIAEAITEAGYRSFSKNLVSLVRQTCYRSNLIRTKERGKFAAVRASKSPALSRKRGRRARKKGRA